LKNKFLDRTYFKVITKSESLMPFYITTIGSHINQLNMFRENGLPDHQLLYTESGSGSALISGSSCTLTKGSLYYIPPNTQHNYHPTSNTWTTYWLTFSGTAFSNFFNYNHGIWYPDKNFDFLNMFCELFKAVESGNQKYSGVLLYKLLCECMDFVPQTQEQENRRQKLAPALEFINQNYNKDIEIKTLAYLTNISFEHFCRLFKSYTGNRPVEYITLLRIQKAKELRAKNPDMKISEIAKAVGFETAAYFSKQFKKYENITPREFS